MERPPLRSRPKSGFSFKSDKSHSSKNSGKHREHLRETTEEKRKTHFSATTKANPNAAMTEAQPVAAQLEDSTLGSLRSIQHTDLNGNVIAEPDLSNPTRSRWERPLDTIRSFEAAIDGEYRRRQSIMRTESAHDGFASRRSSYFGGYDHHYNNHRQSYMGGYYGNRQTYAESSYGQPMPGPTPRNRYSQRMYSDAQVNRSGPGNVYNTPMYRQSRDTVNTGGSGSQSEPLGFSTDPSSENSSIERHTPTTKFENNDNHYSGYGGPVQQPSRISDNPTDRFYGVQTQNRPTQNGGYFQSQHYGAPPTVSAPALGQHRSSNNIIKLGGGASHPQAAAPAEKPLPSKPPPLQQQEKRKSWFKRRFSKQ